MTVLFAPALAYQLPDQTLHTYRCKHCLNLSKETLSTSWLIEDKVMYPASVKPVQSKHYYRTLRGSELKQGVSLGLLADGAAVRVTPIKSDQLPENWRQHFVIKTSLGEQPLVEAATSFSDENEFKSYFSVGPALIFQLKPGLSAQKPKISYADAQDNSLWRLSVYDRNASLYLSIILDKTHYHIGDTINAQVNISDGVFLPEVNWIDSTILSPTGENIPVKLIEDSQKQYHATIPVQSDLVAQGENWYFMVMADMKVNGEKTLRSAQAAFSYIVPSAKVRSVYRPDMTQPLSVMARVENIQESRYQLQAVFYATGNDGDVHAVALAQTSAWLAPGITELPLRITQPLPVGMHSPYYLGQIELVDDAQLKPVYRYNAKISLKELDA
jgi:hypothetical protein